MTPKELILAGADWIETKGWGQYGYRGGAHYLEPGKDPMECACIMNSIGSVSLAEDVRDDGADIARGLLKRALGVQTHGDAFAWNDTPGRTKAEVLEVMRRAAA